MVAETDTYRFLYVASAGVYQLALAALVLSAGRPDAVRGAVAFVLVANGLQGLSDWFPGNPFHGTRVTGRALDGAIVASLAFALSQFPTPLGGARGARIARWAWGGSVLAFAAYAASRPTLPPMVEPLVGYHPFFLPALAVLAVHTLPKTLRLPAGPLRVQSSLLAAGIGIGVVRIGAHSAFETLRADRFLAAPPAGAHAAVDLTLGFFAAAAVATALVGAVRRPAADTGLLAFALAAVPLLVVAQFEGVLLPDWTHLTTAFRPILISAALLRFDLFRVPRALRRPLVPLSVALFVVALFVFVHDTMGGQLLQRDLPFDARSSVAALVVIAVMGVAARSALDAALAAGRAPEEAAYARERLDRYRLALEKARATPTPEAEHEAERLRRSLGISLAEHDAVASLLEGNVVIPATALHGAAPGHVVARRYEVVSELGRGGQGRVLLARDRATGVDVALKELPRPWTADADARRDALRREAAAAARVRSDRVARVLDLAETPLETYLVREFVPGEPLDGVVAAKGAFRTAAAVAVADDVLAGLEAVHAAGLAHLDVKPANVILRPDGRAVLIDQGASRVAADPDATRATDSNRLVTLRWAAPEQLDGRACDARTDVHQAGSVLYFLLTGLPPAAAATEAAVSAALRGARPLAWPDGVPETLRRVVERARAPDPAARYATAAAMRAELSAALIPAGT